MYVFKKYRFLLKNTGLWASKYRFVFPEVGMSAHSHANGLYRYHVLWFSVLALSSNR